ncbi:MAG TPA: uracil phosphoribosyltransferase [Anaeromyxobacteraceae bacterium]|nr:uracil phosphoribosyltransferase [Anaeromyxobacteraceae bacterium]
MRDQLYESVPYRVPEIEHRYGPQVHLLADPFLLDLLAKLAARETIQPALNRLAVDLYRGLARVVLNAEFPRRVVEVPTRMHERNPEGVFRGQIIDPGTRAVTVNIARAGALPSHTVFDLLNTVLDPRQVRQDHIVMSRMLGEGDHVVGAGIGGMKIGGDVQDAFLLFPDPMGATGSSLSLAVDTYKKKVPGRARRIIGMHLIVTPEYLRRMRDDHPDVVVYAVRLDRGLSPPEVQGTIPGTLWDRERGLDEHDYIVPGAGGLGEVMNNAWV